MTKERAGLFEANVDVSGFAPRPATTTHAAPAAQVKAVAEQANFKSREPGQTPAAPVARAQRRYRTGRNVQLGIKAKAEVIEAFYAIADQKGWVLGEAFEHAVEALQRSLAPQK